MKPIMPGLDIICKKFSYGLIKESLFSVKSNSSEAIYHSTNLLQGYRPYAYTLKPTLRISKDFNVLANTQNTKTDM